MKKENFLQLLLFFAPFLFVACEKDNGNDSVVPITPPAPISLPNNAPVARAGNDSILYMPLDFYTLDASTSSDADGDLLSFKWRLIEGPPLNLNDAQLATSKVFLTNKLIIGTYLFELTVTDVHKLSSKDTVKVVCVEPPCTSANKEVIIRDISWNVWWDNSLIIEKVHSYLPPNSYMKKFYIKRDNSNSWITVIKFQSDPANIGKVPEWYYENGTLSIYLGTDTTPDTPDIKIEYCN